MTLLDCVVVVFVCNGLPLHVVPFLRSSAFLLVEVFFCYSFQLLTADFCNIVFIDHSSIHTPILPIHLSHAQSKYFDKHALSLWRTALDADGRRHVRAMKTLEEFVGVSGERGELNEVKWC